MAKKFKMKAPINEILGVVGGAVAAGYVAKLVNDKLPNLNSTVKSLIPIGLGVVLAGNKNTIVRGIGFGMVGKGGADLASAFLPGVGNVDDIFLSSPADQSILSLPADMSVLSGDEDFMNGDEDFMNGDEDFMNGDEDFMNGDEDFMNGDEDFMNGEEISQAEELQF
jgi:hypothetical protein